MPLKEGVSGSIPGRQSSGPKERYPGYGSLYYTQYGVLLFLFSERSTCSRYNARHTPVTYGIPSDWTQKIRNSFQKPSDRFNGQDIRRNGTLRVS